MEWLIALAVLGLAVGAGAGYLLASRSSRGSANRARELEAELDASRRELGDYRAEVVDQFRETARKFQTLNDSYTDLHQQLAKSASLLCDDTAGQLLSAPLEHTDLLGESARPVNDREPDRGRQRAAAGGVLGVTGVASGMQPTGEAAGSGPDAPVIDPYEDDAPVPADIAPPQAAQEHAAAVDPTSSDAEPGEDIRVAEPTGSAAAGDATAKSPEEMAAEQAGASGPADAAAASAGQTTPATAAAALPEAEHPRGSSATTAAGDPTLAGEFGASVAARPVRDEKDRDEKDRDEKVRDEKVRDEQVLDETAGHDDTAADEVQTGQGAAGATVTEEDKAPGARPDRPQRSTG